MKRIMTIAVFALLMMGFGNNGNKAEQNEPSEVCVWENGQWDTDWMQKYVEYARPGGCSMPCRWSGFAIAGV